MPGFEIGSASSGFRYRIQNFLRFLCHALRRQHVSELIAFLGQLSAIVEPIAAVIGQQL